MRRTVALIAALVTALLVGAPPASAAGPTSVLLVNYDGNRAAGALTGSAAYAALAEALDVYDQPTGRALPPGSFMQSSVRLTWMIHDVTPWRIDAVLVDGNDVWVETTMDTGTGKGLFEGAGVRHRPADARLLLATLAGLGVLGTTKPAAGAGDPGAGRAMSTPVEPPASTADRAPATAASSPPSGLQWWGVAAAALLALGLGWVVGRRGRTSERFERPDATREDEDVVSPVGFTIDRPSPSSGG